MSGVGARITAHLWCVDLDIDTDLNQLVARLAKDERDRAASFVFERDRRRFAVARSTLRSILSLWVGIAPQRLELEYSSRRKPQLAPWCRVADLRFNVSHSQGLALVVLTHGHEIGVDIEQIRYLEDARALAASEFSDAERAAFEALPVAFQSEAFLRAWVRKEAFLKATGEGLHRSLADIEVTFAPHEDARLLAVSSDVNASQRWSMISLVPCAGFTGAIVAEAPAVELASHGFYRAAQPV